MRRTILILIVGLGLGASAFAGGGEERTFGDGVLPMHLDVYDVNGDGSLSVEEIQAMKRDRASRHDATVVQWDTDG